MTDYCECSGTYKCVKSADDMHSDLETFRNIARYYNFEWLLETVEWHLSDAGDIELH
jgi:hypothetical protein